jgi:hypothetical protein
MLTTPTFLIGYPVYDVNSATSYLERQLRRLGYHARRAMPNVIHVEWERPTPSHHVTVIDHSNDESNLPSLANLAKAAQRLRSKN